MPLYPQGGGLFPNSIDNVLLADMAEATVKGRAAGAGAGDPQDLTVAQLQAMFGTSVFTQCRFVYVSAAALRLDRYNGCLITINDKPEVIPVAGVSYPVAGLTPNLLYYAYVYMIAGVMTPYFDAAVPIVDPRNGTKVHPTNATVALVGMVRPITGPNFAYSPSQLLVRSWYNDPGIEGRNFLPASLASGGPFGISEISHATIIEALVWAGEVGFATITGNVTWTVSNTLIFTGVGIDGVTPEEGFDLKQNSAANYQQSIHAFANFGQTRILSEGYHYWTILASSNAASATWAGSAAAGSGRCAIFLTTRGRGG